LESKDIKGSVVYLSHGGGPLPLLRDESHYSMIKFMNLLAQKIQKPEAIIVISAHWEESIVSIIGSKNTSLLYDYYGFPPETYALNYNLPGNPELVKTIQDILVTMNIEVKEENNRGFDHGVFIPLMLMYPEGNIPTVQISLIKGLNPETHINLGKALKKILEKNVLIIGSGFSFHNMNAFTFSKKSETDKQNDAFQNKLIEICECKTSVSESEKALIRWEKLPFARYCHPREEHLLPLHVCFGLTEKKGNVIFDDNILGKRAISVLW